MANQEFPGFFKEMGKSYQDTLPWLSSPSILLAIQKHYDPDSGKLKTDIVGLPDETRWRLPGEIKYAEGAYDSIFMRPSFTDEEITIANALLDEIRLIANGDQQARVRLYKMLLDAKIVHLIDPFLEAFSKSNIPSHPYLYEFIHFLAANSPDRVPVKFALSLLGLIGTNQDIAIIQLLGIHEEFTLFSAIAMINLLDDPEEMIWDLSKKTSLWGRVHTVNLLAETKNPEIKQWLLLKAHHGSPLVSKIALTCALTGDLHIALDQKDIDETVFYAAGTLLSAMLDNGMGTVLEQYEYAALCIESYLKELDTHISQELDPAESLDYILFLADLYEYLTNDFFELDEVEDCGWTTENYQRTLGKTRVLIALPIWYETIESHLNALDYTSVSRGLRIARLIGLDTWEYCQKMLLEDPLNTLKWEYLLGDASPERIDEIVTLANELLPLDDLASGPKEEIGSGDEYMAHNSLSFILQTLEEYPGKGWHLVKTALKNPVIRLRNMALRTMRYWGKENWPDETLSFLKSCHRMEPDPETREMINEYIILLEK